MVEHAVDLAQRLGGWGYLLVFLVVMLECQPLLGLFMPGETLVVVSGFLAGQGVFDLGLLILTIGVAAVVGDTIGYELGRRLGRGWLLRYGPWFGVHERHLARVDGYLARHGGKSVFFSHFMHLLRALMPFIAGAGRMPYRRFALYNTIGCFLWASVFAVLGYFFGESWELLHRWAGRAGSLLGALLILVLVLVWIWQWIARNDIELRMRWQRWLGRPRVVAMSARIARHLDFLLNRLTPAGYLALHLLLGALIIVLVSWSFGGALSQIIGRHPFLAVDDRIAFWFLEHGTSAIIRVAEKITLLGSALFLTIASIVTVFVLAWQRYWSGLALLLLTTLGGSALGIILKILDRQPLFFSDVLSVLPTDRFPSVHAMGAALFYGAVAILVARRVNALRWQALALLVAGLMVLLIGLTRIYLGAHYLSNVIAAMLAGFAWVIWSQAGLAVLRRRRHS